MRSTRAAVYHGPGDIRLEELPLPDLGPGDVLVRVDACGICGSDVMDWYMAPRAPIVLGHEVAATVLATGPGASLHPGQRAFVHHHVPCMTCHDCLRGRETLCLRFRQTRLHPGGLAEHLVVPAENARADALPLPDDLDDGAATFVEPLACAVRGQRKAHLRPGDSVAVVGAGVNGILNARLARASHAGAVVALDVNEDRLRAARELGLTAVHAEDAAADALRDATGGRLADVVIVCAGAAAAVELGLRLVARGGTLQLFAPLHPGEEMRLSGPDPFFAEVEVQHTYSAAPRDTRTALHLLATGHVQVSDLVTHRLPLERTAEAVALVKGGGKALKVVVEPHAAKS